MEPIFVMFTIFVAAAIVLWSLNLRFRRRELMHKERLAALEKGVSLPPLEPERELAPWTPRVYLLRGMIWMFCGLALTLALFALALTSDRPITAEDRILRAARARQSGATDDEAKLLLNDASLRNPHIPEGFALLGLIPAGVGLSYLLFYRVEGRKLAS